MCKDKPKTRHDSSWAMVDYLEVGKELIPSEVPTLRAAMQLALHLQDERWRLEDIDKKNYPVKELMRDVSNSVLAQWERANILFKSFVSQSKSVVMLAVLDPSRNHHV